MQMIRTIVGATLAAAALAASPAAAQTAEQGATVTVQGGGFSYSREGGDLIPMGAVRVDWPVSRYLRAEVGSSYARPGTTMTRPIAQGVQEAYQTHSSLATATVGLQAQLPTRLATPYVGIATGLFGRLDPDGGDRFIRPTQEVMAGLRVPVRGGIGLRGELRYRMDQHQDGVTGSNMEHTLGVTIKL
ncbi:MAG TPA: outer membrane beta-barrel protein [Longimicrobium sp.]|uniref:outer membrane beta-barrel protein n=1 Tax=Longimicrobium sp. TaxID=2029185 RepID=UPI002ED7A15B